MKDNGLEQKKMVKELKFGQMDMFMKVNFKIVSGAVKEFYLFQMEQLMKENGLKIS